MSWYCSTESELGVWIQPHLCQLWLIKWSPEFNIKSNSIFLCLHTWFPEVVLLFCSFTWFFHINIFFACFHRELLSVETMETTAAVIFEECFNSHFSGVISPVIFPSWQEGVCLQSQTFFQLAKPFTWKWKYAIHLVRYCFFWRLFDSACITPSGNSYCHNNWTRIPRRSEL